MQDKTRQDEMKNMLTNQTCCWSKTISKYTGRLEEWIILCCFIRCITTECAIDLGSAWLNLLQLHPLKKCNIEERTIIVSLRDTLPNENFIAVK